MPIWLPPANSTKPRKTDTAYERLRECIVMLELKPGAFVDERELMVQLDVGRTPIREAIQRLIQEGLITDIPRRGRWISALTMTDLHHVTEARQGIELESARLAARRATPAMISEIRSDLDQVSEYFKREDHKMCVLAHQRFHESLAHATGNPYLVRLMENIHHTLLRYWYVSFINLWQAETAFAHHYVILDAIASGDPDESERVMRDHMDLFRERLSCMVASNGLTDGHVDNILR